MSPKKVTRYRRTNQEIELATQLDEAIKTGNENDAYRLRAEIKAIEARRRIELGLNDDDAIEAHDDDSAIGNDSATEKLGGVEFETIETDDSARNEKFDIDAVALQVSQRVTKTVMNTVLDELDSRTKNILDHVKAATQVKAVIAAIRVNDGDVKKLKNAAHPNLVELISVIKAGLQPLLVGPSGCGKTYVAEQVSEALKLEFGHLCFSAGVSETWLYGRQTPNGFIEGDFSRLYRDGGVFLADEIDAADSNLLLTLNTALANGHLYNPISGQRIERNENFVFIGGANTFGKGGNNVYTGRNRLDGATLNRFTVIRVGYIPEVEAVLCPNTEIREKLQSLRVELDKRGASEIISYRDFEKASSLLALQWSQKKILDTLTASWPETLRNELGIREVKS